MFNAVYCPYNLSELPNRSILKIFNTASVDETHQLGAAFALALLSPLRLNRPHKGKRVGIVGNSDIGKSIFADGILSAIPNLRLIDNVRVEKDDYKEIVNSLWDSERFGIVRHYDAYIRHIQLCLPGCNKNSTQDLSSFTDIVEHPHKDRHNAMFNYIVGIECDPALGSDDARKITVAATSRQAKTCSFRKFLHAAAPFLASQP